MIELPKFWNCQNCQNSRTSHIRGVPKLLAIQQFWQFNILGDPDRIFAHPGRVHVSATAVDGTARDADGAEPIVMRMSGPTRTP
jgi:hypothetical protein